MREFGEIYEHTGFAFLAYFMRCLLNSVLQYEKSFKRVSFTFNPFMHDVVKWPNKL